MLRKDEIIGKIESSELESKDKKIDQGFFKQASTINENDFLENPTDFFYDSLSTYVDVRKIEQEAILLDDPTGKKAILSKGYFLFCMQFAKCLKELNTLDAVYPNDDKGVNKKLKHLLDLAEDTTERRNIRRCRDCSIINKSKNSDGSIKYRFADDNLIEYFIVRHMYEASKVGYDLVLLSIKSKTEKEKFIKDNRFDDYSILFKRKNFYSIYLRSQNKIINKLDANKFKEIQFPKYGEARVLRGIAIPQKIYDEITLKSSTTASSSNMKALR